MKPATLLVLAAMVAVSPCIAWTADAVTEKQTGQINAERRFGDVRFVMGAGKAAKSLEIYVDGNLIAGFQDFLADEVIASPDGQHFLALSNSSKSAYAFAILNRRGQIEASGIHGGDLHYCNRTSWGIGEWVDTQKPQPTFSMEKNQLTTPASEYLQVTVRGCDGKTVILARAPRPSLKGPSALLDEAIRNGGDVTAAAAAVQALRPQESAPAPVNYNDRSSFFIGNTIAKLRDLDPAFGARTLTLVDGRRSDSYFTTKAINVPVAWTDAPLSRRDYFCSPGAACRAADLLISRPDGSMQVIATGVAGDFIALPRARRVFACAGSSYSEQKAPSVIDLDGNKTSLPSHPGPLRVCARTGTGDEVLLVYTMAETGKRYTLARVFDAHGALLTEGTFDAEGSVRFKVAGKRYSATVPAL